MANDGHIARLEKGVGAWNAWREENRDIRLDLSGVDLSRANLGGANFGAIRPDFSAIDDLTQLLKTDRTQLAKAPDLRSVRFIEANLSKAKFMQEDLSGADLSGADLNQAHLNQANLQYANLSGANLSGACLIEAHLDMANLNGANFTGVTLSGAHIQGADLSGTDLSGANLHRMYLVRANLQGANLCGADLRAATLLESDLTGADLTGCRIWGISAWGLKLDGAKQQNLVITYKDEPVITVDNIEVAQFIYLMLNNQKVRDVIDTITSKVVLILGRFTDERKAVLDALREELRKRDFLPILFDFNVPATRDITETISLLARMARFVVADITDAKSIPQELATIVPDLPSVPVQPLLLEGSAEYGMFEHFKRYPWVLETYRYASSERLIASLGERVIGPAENYARSVRK
jgi:uncharacterized protein YjbI with pentapeptide repeats